MKSDWSRNFYTQIAVNIFYSALIACLVDAFLIMNINLLLAYLDQTRYANMMIFQIFRMGTITTILYVLIGIGVFSLTLLLLERKTMKYIGKIAMAIQNISEGDLNTQIEVVGDDEFSAMASNLNRMEADIRKLMDKERESERTKNELITNVAHDLRTPLTSIIGYLELLAGNTQIPQEMQHKYIEIAYSKSRRLEKLIEETGYVKELEAEDTDEAKARIENIDELISKAASYEDEAEDPSLSGFLEEVALIADIDSVEESDNRVLLMTLHSAKGLEFPNVYLAGMEDGIFPGYMTIVGDDPQDMEEERRLCYVGITRAMKELTLSAAQQRMIRGETQYNKVSRFIREIPRELVELGREPKARRITKMPEPSSSYAKMRQTYQKTSFSPKQFEVKKSQGLAYGVGDTVRHIKFGTGTVQAIVDGGKDYEVTVDFDKAGTKKMFASFAKLKKITE